MRSQVLVVLLHLLPVVQLVHMYCVEQYGDCYIYNIIYIHVYIYYMIAQYYTRGCEKERREDKGRGKREDRGEGSGGKQFKAS